MSCARGCCPDQRAHYLSVAVSAAATPTRRAEVNATVAMEKEWDKDHAAYRRLRKDGFQPRSSKGAAKVEARATTRAEVEGTPE